MVDLSPEPPVNRPHDRVETRAYRMRAEYETLLASAYNALSRAFYWCDQVDRCERAFTGRTRAHVRILPDLINDRETGIGPSALWKIRNEAVGLRAEAYVRALRARTHTLPREVPKHARVNSMLGRWKFERT